MAESLLKHIEIQTDLAHEVIQEPGLCDLGLSNTALQECGVYTLPTRMDDELNRPDGVQLLIIRGDDQIRSQIEQAINSSEARTSFSPDDIRHRLPPIDEANSQVICIERVGKRSSQQTRISILQTGQTELSDIYTEQSGHVVTYKKNPDPGSGSGWRSISIEGGHAITHLIVGGSSDYIEQLTGSMEATIEASENLGWGQYSAQEHGEVAPLMAKIALYDDPNHWYVRESSTEAVRKWIEQASARSSDEIPIIVIRENNEVVA